MTKEQSIAEMSAIFANLSESDIERVLNFSQFVSGLRDELRTEFDCQLSDDEALRICMEYDRDAEDIHAMSDFDDFFDSPYEAVCAYSNSMGMFDPDDDYFTSDSYSLVSSSDISELVDIDAILDSVKESILNDIFRDICDDNKLKGIAENL